MSARVPFAALAEEHAPLRDELARAFDAVVARGEFILGGEVERFEHEVAGWLGARSAVSVSSGSDALVVALAAAGVGRGDVVVTSPMSFIATAESICRVGATPRFVDVDPETLALDPGGLDAALAAGARAVVPVHLYGHTAGVEAVLDVARARGVPVVEDAAQAFGSRTRGGAAGTLGTAGCFSFFPAKVLGALGDGGLVVAADDEVASRCRRLRQHGMVGAGEYAELGGNFRLDALQASALRVKLPRVAAWIASRRARAAVYEAELREVSGLRSFAPEPGWNGAIFTVRVQGGRRDALRAFLADRGVEARSYYARPLHLAPALAFLGERPGAFPGAERLASEVLSLPLHPALRDDQQAFVVDAVQAFFRER